MENDKIVVRDIITCYLSKSLCQLMITKCSSAIEPQIGSKQSGQNRIPFVDSSKGLAMLIIMWGHVQEYSSLKMWLTSFHVPVFLVLSGVLFAYKGRSGGAKILFVNYSLLISHLA